MKIIAILIVILALTACASTPSNYEHWAAAVASQHQFAQSAASECETDLCRYVVTQEVTKHAIQAPKKQYHPAWQLLDRTLSVALPLYLGFKQSEQWADALVSVTSSVTGMERSFVDNSVSVGGDQIGGDRVDDSSVGRDQIGGDYVGRDLVGGDWRTGDDINYSDTCVGDDCASHSPVDSSDNSDSSTSTLSDFSDHSTNTTP